LKLGGKQVLRFLEFKIGRRMKFLEREVTIFLIKGFGKPRLLFEFRRLGL
jgi:hypothetical protein